MNLSQTRPPRLARTRLPRKARAGMVAGVGREGRRGYFFIKKTHEVLASLASKQ